MNERLTYWNQMIKSYPIDNLAKDLNVSWDPYNKKYTSQQVIPSYILEKMGDVKSVLDFGCGLGRNLDYLSKQFPNVLGYDLPAMVERTKEIPFVHTVTSGWKDIENKSFDLIYSCTVIQHLDLEEVNRFKELAVKTAKYVFLHTRSYNDVGRVWTYGIGGTNIASLFDSRFKIVECSINPNLAKSLWDETHYDILYKIDD